MPRLVQRLRRALSIEPGEGALVLWSAATLFLVESASVAVSNVSDTLFLKRVGVDYLPIVFLANSILLTGTTFVAGRLSVRFEQGRLLLATFVVLAALLVVLWALVVAEAPGISTTLVIVSKQIDVIALLLFWTAIGTLMTSRQSKRLVALMTAGGTLGTIAGSFASGPVGEHLGIPALLVLAAVAFVLAAVVTLPLRRAGRPRLYRGRAPAGPASRPTLRELWAESSLFRVLVGSAFLAGVLGPMLYFEFSRAADLATQVPDGEQELLELYGLLRGWINVGVLAVQVGVSAALFRLVGVPAAAALAPATYVLGFSALGVRFGLSTAMPAMMTTSVLDHTVYEPALRILGALLPPRFRTGATSIIQGPSKRAGAAAGSLLVLLVVAAGNPDAVAYAALPVAGLWMLLSVLLWRDYPNLLMEAASVRRGAANGVDAIVPFLDSATRRVLQRNLEGPDPLLCRAACGLFLDGPRAMAVDAFARAIPRAPQAHRAALVEALDEVLHDPAATEAVDAAFVARVALALEPGGTLGAEERARLLQVLGRVAPGHASAARVRELVQKACANETGTARAVARIARARLAGEALDEILAEELASHDVSVRSTAVAELRFELLRAGGDVSLRTRHLALLTEQLSRTSDDSLGDARRSRVRRETIEALAEVALAYPNAVGPSVRVVLSLADDPDPSVRSAVLRFVGNAGLFGHAGLLAERLSSRVVEESLAARDALERLGPRAADALLHALHRGGRRARELAPALLLELQADPAVLRGLVDREIGSARELLVSLAALEAADVSRLVLQHLRERADDCLHCALELLAALAGDERIAEVCRTLGRGWNQRDRAVLLEALEALLPAEEGERILPLLEEQGAQRLAAATAHGLGHSFPTAEQALAQALASQDPLTTALVAATVERTLLARAAPELDVEAALRLFTPRPAPASPRDAATTVEEDVMLSPVERILHLRTLDLFEGLSTRQLSELARVVREVTVPDGEAIVTEGEYDDSMYFIVHGRVRIDREGRPLAELGPRDFFGEMAVFDGERRSATATAVGRVALLRLARNDLFEVMEDQPAIGIGICQTLVRRVRNLLDERAAPAPA